MALEYGGKTVFGASVGILMLESRFPRIIGDMGNAESWPFPVHYKVVPGATPDNVVRGDPRLLVDQFIAAGQELVDMGVDGITTTCGFLTLVQEELKEALKVPVATSSLMQIPTVQTLLPVGQRAAVITISKANLTKAHLGAAGAAMDTPIFGTDDGRCFTRDVLDDAVEIDFAACREDMLDVARQIIQSEYNIGAIVLECANMAPYAYDVRKITGLPVFSVHSFIGWFQSGLRPRKFPLELADPRY